MHKVSASGVCTNPQDRRCQEAITESCETFINNSEDYEQCKDKIISTNTTAYGNYVMLANDTPMAISAMIQAEDTSGLMAIIKLCQISQERIQLHQKNNREVTLQQILFAIRISPHKALRFYCKLASQILEIENARYIHHFLKVSNKNAMH